MTSTRAIKVLITTILSAVYISTSAQNFYYHPKSSAEILHDLKKAEVTGTVMYIAAHPDDENTRLISWLTNEKKVNVVYLSLTRGDGGQNLVGPEIREGLGVIRTQELLQARATDGGTQMFTRANDFGYSKTPEESFKIWDRDQVLADVVWAIRKTRPDVIITRFSTEKRIGRATHGHHTASALLASEAFDLAGDPNAYPEQLQYVETWQPKRLFWNTSWWFFGSQEKFEESVKESPGKYLKFEVSNFIEELGLSCSEVASLSRSHHKSQGFGSTPERSTEYEYLQLIKGEPAQESLFEGVDLTWNRMGMGDLLKKYQKVISQYDIQAPHKSIEGLSQIIKEIKGRKSDDPHWQGQLLQQLNDLVFDCSRVYIEATCSKEFVTSGETVEVKLRVVNRIGEINVTWNAFEMAPFLQEKQLAVPVNGEETYTDEVIISRDMPVSQPYWLNLQATTGMYFVGDQEMIGKPVAENPLGYMIKLNINGTTIYKNIPVVYSITDPVKGEVKYPMIVVPNVMVNLKEDVYLFPDNAPREVMMEVIAGKDSISGFVELNLPEGWKCEPKFHQVELKLAGEKQLVTFKITPSSEQFDGQLSGYFKTFTDVYGLGFQHIKYDHIPPQAIFTSCEARLVRTDIDIDPSIRKVGYIQGAGDMVPEALALLGLNVEQLNPADITAELLSTYDAIIVGIRAYNTVDEMAFISPLLNDFVFKGGVVVVQYNTSHRLVTEEIGPYPIRLSRDRVTEEDAAVELLAKKDPVLNWPNTITTSDFDGWVQERGLYFPDEWSDKYIPVIRIADTNEDPSDGSILVAYHGKGKFVYTGISFFRLFPAGVPGSYRLMANLISNPKR